MKYILLIFSILFFGTIGSSQNTLLNKLTASEKEEGWKLLFNGENLDGWKIFQGGVVSGWRVSDGILYNSGIGSDHGGDIVTIQKFQEFKLYLEWKINPQSNSGIFFKVNENIGKAIYESGPEYQLIDDLGWPEKLLDDQHTGSNYGMHPPVNTAYKKAGEWNKTLITVEGNHVTHYLNDTKIVDYHFWDEDWKKRKQNGKWKNFADYGMAIKGHIGLQDHGGLTQFRNIKIKVIR
jgi:hypothetical protein